jgi:hypothetical protein
MASMGAVAVWGPMSTQAVSEVRLTRRGRLLRSLAMLLVVVALAAVSVARLAGEPVRAGAVEVTTPVATASVVVEQGDSLWNIAQRLAPATDPREVVHEMRELNGLRSNLIQPGQVLLVPSGL